jgi:hypothetical protein
MINFFKKNVFIILPLIGVTIFGILSFFITTVPEQTITKQTANNLQNIFSSICASFIFLLTINIGAYLQDKFKQKMFRLFFGELSVSSTSNLIYPDFVLSEDCLAQLKKISPTRIYAKATRPFPGSRFIDVPKIVASNDLQGIVIFASIIGKYLSGSPALLSDDQVITNHSKSLVSFGLTSNSVTDLYQQHDAKPLFKIINEGTDPKIVIKTIDGKEVTYGREDSHQHGIILRYRPHPDDYPNRFWFICAGLAAAGTPASAYLLAHKWKQYYDRFGNRDFLIILKSSNNIHAYSSAWEVASFVRNPE